MNIFEDCGSVISAVLLYIILSVRLSVTRAMEGRTHHAQITSAQHCERFVPKPNFSSDFDDSHNPNA